MPLHYGWSSNSHYCPEETYLYCKFPSLAGKGLMKMSLLVLMIITRGTWPIGGLHILRKPYQKYIASTNKMSFNFDLEWASLLLKMSIIDRHAHVKKKKKVKQVCQIFHLNYLKCLKQDEFTWEATLHKIFRFFSDGLKDNCIFYSLILFT